MNKTEMKCVLESNDFKTGGTKEACVKARDFLKYVEKSENGIISNNSCVSSEEFVEAVKTLIAYSFGKEDTVPKRWYCDNDCRYVHSSFCKGECNIDNSSLNLCPFYSQEWD